MNLPLILSIIAIVVSVSMSIITLLLTEFRGPNISLLNDPEFAVTDEGFSLIGRQGHTPRWFHLKKVPLVFANHGGKSGTILNLKLDFAPYNSFRCFFHIFYARMVIYEGDLSPPITIGEGDNECLETSPEICTIDWKKTALAEVLEPNLKIDDIVEKAGEKSKEKFTSFCDFLDESQELGKVSCTITLTKGRFRTKVTEERIFENLPIVNKYNEAVLSLRGLVPKWKNLKPTKAELLNMLIKDREELTKELKGNLSVLAKPLSGYDIEKGKQACKLRVDKWNQFQRIRDAHERKIRWFLIKSEKELEQKLTKLYKKIMDYNRSIDELILFDELGTHESVRYRRVNAKKERLHSEVEKMCDRLSHLYRRSIS